MSIDGVTAERIARLVLRVRRHGAGEHYSALDLADDIRAELLKAGMCEACLKEQAQHEDTLCQDCIADRCVSCRDVVVSEEGDQCGSCQGDAMDHGYDAYRERGAA